ncbi:MAG: glycosyltransferase family 39 protein, partial [Candidatus Eremiobacteraeota bacterium]|nr:glycosyltransferase family 39 protein [Candidatus Eremiobacteraeota bacterium]
MRLRLNAWDWAAIALVLCGVILRLDHLDWKVYNSDETTTSLRAAGWSEAAFHGFVGDGRRHRLADLVPFQAARNQTTAADTVAALAHDEPQHPPLFFLLERAVSAAAGPSIWWQRAAPAVFGILMLPLLWLLARELFGRSPAAAIAAGLAAVSPYHVVLSQYARQYSLWAALICLSSFTLLRALRRPSALAWSYYAAATALSLWTFTFSLYVLAAHAIYVLFVVERRAKVAWLVAAAVAVVSFAPWLVAIARNWGTVIHTTAWLGSALPPKILLGKWAFNLGTVFFDLDYLSLKFLPMVAFALMVAALSCVALIRWAPRNATWFVLALGGTIAVGLAAPDFVAGTSRSTAARYLVPLPIALELATAFAIACFAAVGGLRSALAAATFTLLAAGGLASCIVSGQARSWWISSNERTIPAVSAALEARGGAPLIVYVATDNYLLELVHDPLASGPAAFEIHRPARWPGDVALADVYLIGKSPDVAADVSLARVRRLEIPVYFPTQDATVTGVRQS